MKKKNINGIFLYVQEVHVPGIYTCSRKKKIRQNAKELASYRNKYGHSLPFNNDGSDKYISQYDVLHIFHDFERKDHHIIIRKSANIEAFQERIQGLLKPSPWQRNLLKIIPKGYDEFFGEEKEEVSINDNEIVKI